MTTLLTFRNNVGAFYSRYDYIITPILKAVLALLVFLSINGQMGYADVLNNVLLLLVLSCVCAFLPVELIVAIGAGMILMHSFKVSIDVALTGLALILIFYCGYMRFVTKTGIIALLVPMFYAWHLIYALPIVLGFMVGPVAIIPTVFGVILYYFQQGMKDFVNVMAAATEVEEAVQGYQYIVQLLLDNKFMLLTIVAFTVVILVTYAIYRASFANSWLVAFLVGGLLNVILFLIGSVTLSIDIQMIPILIGTIVGILIAIVIQFAKGIVDYQRTELLQFEDDEYYYYVKAVPKLSVAESNKNVKHINSKTYN